MSSERFYLLISTESQDASRDVIENPLGLTVPSGDVDDENQVTERKIKQGSQARRHLGAQGTPSPAKYRYTF
jgi:hypothetical protein